MTTGTPPSASTDAAGCALDGPDVFASRSPWRRAANDFHDERRTFTTGESARRLMQSHRDRQVETETRTLAHSN